MNELREFEVELCLDRESPGKKIKILPEFENRPPATLITHSLSGSPMNFSLNDDNPIEFRVGITLEWELDKESYRQYREYIKEKEFAVTEPEKYEETVHASISAELSRFAYEHQLMKNEYAQSFSWEIEKRIRERIKHPPTIKYLFLGEYGGHVRVSKGNNDDNVFHVGRLEEPTEQTSLNILKDKCHFVTPEKKKIILHRLFNKS